ATNLAAPSTSCSNARSRSTSNASWQRNHIFGGEQVSPLSNSIHIGPNSFESHHPYAASTHATLRQLLAATVLIGHLLPSVSHNRSSTRRSGALPRGRLSAQLDAALAASLLLDEGYRGYRSASRTPFAFAIGTLACGCFGV